MDSAEFNNKSMIILFLGQKALCDQDYNKTVKRASNED